MDKLLIEFALTGAFTDATHYDVDQTNFMERKRYSRRY
jgi:hypothetical protein